MPSSPGRTTAARSSSVSPGPNGLVRTRNAQQFLDLVAREALASRCYGVLKIEDQRVGAAGGCLGEFVRAVGGHKQERAQLHVGRRIIRPVRRQYATSSSR